MVKSLYTEEVESNINFGGSTSSFDYCSKANGSCNACPIQRDSADCVKRLADNFVKNAIEAEVSKLAQTIKNDITDKLTKRNITFYRVKDTTRLILGE